MTALAEFRAAYTAMLLAAERVRIELDPCADKVPQDIRRIQAAVASAFGMPLSRLLSRTRDDDTSTARQVAMVLCRELTKHNLSSIGDAFHRDHGTVVHAIRAIADRTAQDPKLTQTINNLRTTCAQCA